jgi:cell division protein FtsZ
MKDSGVAIMGSATAPESAENRALLAVERAMNSPLLNDNDIRGARYILLNVTYGSDELTMDEFAEISDYIQDAAGGTANLIKGFGQDPSLGDKISVTVIATGFTGKNNIDYGIQEKPERIVKNLYTGPAKTETPVTKAPEPVAETPQPKKEEEKITITPAPAKKEEVKAEEEPVKKIVLNLSDKTEKEDMPKLRINSDDQVTMDFGDVSPATPKSVYMPSHLEPPKDVAKPKNKLKAAEPVPEVEDKIESDEKESTDPQQKRANDRIARIKQVNSKMQSTQGLSDLERMPAYLRKNVQLDDAPPSDESQVSRFTLSDDEEGERKIELRQNNSFLHDNVD